MRADSSQESKLQSPCGAVREDCQVGMPAALRDRRRAPPSTFASRICLPLRWRAVSPGAGRSAQQATSVGEQRRRNCDHPLSITSRRSTHLLPSRGCVTTRDEKMETTSSAHGSVLAVPVQSSSPGTGRARDEHRHLLLITSIGVTVDRHQVLLFERASDDPIQGKTNGEQQVPGRH